MESAQTQWTFRLKALLLAGVVAVILATATVWVKWPLTKARLAEALEATSGRKVTVGSFEMSHFPPGLVAGDIRFLRQDHPEREPLIVIKRLEVKTSWGLLLTFGKRIPRVDIHGMHLLIPSSGTSAEGKQHALIPLNDVKGVPSVSFGKVVVHDAMVEFLPKQLGAETFRIPVREITLSRLSNKEPFEFDAVVDNTLPKGEVRDKGTFGPWDAEDPSRTPVKGTYSYHDGHLQDIPGISGTMQAEGKFHGTLAAIEMEGTAEVPDFHVLRSSHTESLHTTYQASVDATNGDVQLHRIDVNVGRTTIHAQGRVMSKLATLQAQVRGGRMEDLERIIMKSKLVPLMGAVSLDASIRLPPGSAPFLKRLEMAGHFETMGESFTNEKTQDALNHLASKETTVQSQMAAAVTVKGGVARIDRLLLTCPATTVLMTGTLDLLSTQVDFQGTLKTDGKLSSTQTGVKEFALKMITPFLKKQKSTVVAFGVKGRYSELSTRLELGKKRSL